MIRDCEGCLHTAHLILNFFNVIYYWIPWIHFFSFPLCHCFSVIETFSGFAVHLIELNSTFRFQQTACFPCLSFVSSQISCFVNDVESHIHKTSLLVNRKNMTICSWFGLERLLQINSFDCSLNLCFPKLLKLFSTVFFTIKN